jgi:hypothetical protein
MKMSSMDSTTDRSGVHWLSKSARRDQLIWKRGISGGIGGNVGGDSGNTGGRIIPIF